MKINFVISKLRKDRFKKSNFDSKLSDYWQKQFYDCFKNW